MRPDPLGARRQARHDGEVAAVAPHHLDDERPPPGHGRLLDLVDGLDDGVQRGVGADGELRAREAVVDAGRERRRSGCGRGRGRPGRLHPERRLVGRPAADEEDPLDLVRCEDLGQSAGAPPPTGPSGSSRARPRPRETQPWTLIQSSSLTSPARSPSKPLRAPRTTCPWSTRRRTAARIAVFMPGAGAPAWRTRNRRRRCPSRGPCGKARTSVFRIAEGVAEAGPAQLHGAVEVARPDRLAHRARLLDVLHERHAGDPVLAQADEARDVVGTVAQDLLHGRDAEEGPHRPVEGARRAAPLDVAEDGRPGLGPEPLLEELADPLGLDRPPLPVDGPLGEDDGRVPAARPPPLGEDRADLLLPVVAVGRRLGDEDPAGARRQGAHQGEVAAVAPHHLDDERPLVARRRRDEGVDRLDDPVERRVGADRHVGAGHVVVDRPDEADEGERRGRLRRLRRELAPARRAPSGGRATRGGRGRRPSASRRRRRRSARRSVPAPRSGRRRAAPRGSGTPGSGRCR